VSVPAVSPTEVAEFAANQGLPERYVMWCGTFEPRKNLPTLLRAFEIARASEPDLGLVLVGPTGWGDVAVPTTPGVRLLGFLGPHDLHLAYAGARAFCYPSLREGFGLPVLEAMAHGVPVVTSAGTAMAEFTEGAGILVDPLDAGAMAEAIVAAAGDEHGALARAAAKRANEYSWDAAAAATIDAYREAVGA
jgi:glycosyltransferase involved in cell wall biosynthesis